MSKMDNQLSLKTALLGGISVMAFTAMVSVSGAMATEVTNGDTITATDATGLVESDEVGPVGVTIDSNTGAITLGADATPAAIVTQSGGITNLTLNITSSGTANGVIFAGDVDANGNAGDTIKINATNDNITFQGNILSTVGSSAADINIGSGAADPTLTMTVDTVNNENLTIEATIDAVDTGDNVTLAVANSDSGNANTVTFKEAIGANEALDQVSIGADTAVTFEAAVSATKITVESKGTTTFSDDVTGNLEIAADGAVDIADGKMLTGNVDNTTGTDGVGTLSVGNSGLGSMTLVSGSIGATNSLKEVVVETSSGNADIGGAVNAVTISVTGTGAVNFLENVTGDINLEAGNNVSIADGKTLDGSVDNKTGLDNNGFLRIGASTVTGDVGASNSLNAVFVSFVGGTAKFEGTVNAGTVNVNQSGTVSFAENVKGNVAFGDDGTVKLAAGKVIDGDVNNTSATPSRGTLEIGAIGADLTVVSGTIGGTDALKAVTVDTSGGTATFGGAVNATTITVSGTGTAAFSDDVTGNVAFAADNTISLAAGKKFVGAVDNTTGSDGAGTLNIDDTSGPLTVVSGAVGATNTLKAVTVNTAGGDATFGDALNTEAYTSTGGNGTVVTTGAKIGNLTADGFFTGGSAVLDINGTINITGGGGLIAGAGDMTLSGATINTPLISLLSGSDVTFDGTSAQMVTGIIDGSGALTVANTKGVTFNSKIGDVAPVDAVTVGATHKATFNQTVEAASIDLNGIIHVEDAITLSGDLNLANGAKIFVGNGITAGETVFTVNDVVSTGTTDIIAPASFTTGTIVLADSTLDASGDIANLSVMDTALATYSIVANGNDIELVAAAKTAAQTTTELGISDDQTKGLTNATLAVATGDTDGQAALTTALVAGGATATNAAKQVAVQAEILSAASVAAIQTGARAIGLSSERLASLRNGKQYEGLAESGFSTGGSGLSSAVWMQAFGNYIDQDSDGGVDGFNARTYGLAVGIDTEVSSNIRLGASFAYGNTDVDGDGAGNASIDTDSYQVTVYADYTAESFYIEGMLGYAHNNNDTSRVVNFGGLDRVAEGDYNSDQFMVSIGGGVPIQLRGTAYFTPMAKLAWTRVSSDSYTETGGGGFSQNINPDDVDAVIGSLGGKLHTKIKADGGFVVPSLTAGVSYDFADDNATATASYTGGGAAFNVTGTDVDQFAGNVGLGLAYEAASWSIGANYDAELKSNSVGHSGRIEARIKF